MIAASGIQASFPSGKKKRGHARRQLLDGGLARAAGSAGALTGPYRIE